METPIGILYMAYGTPNALDEVEPYYTHIRHGRKPTPELLAELTERYRAVGGRTPLNDLTVAQAEGATALLNGDGPARFRAYVGMKHWHPYIGDTVGQMARDGIRRAVGFVLAPQYSSMSVGQYIGYVEKGLAAAGAAIDFTYIKSWHDHPAFIAAAARRVRAALEKFPAGLRDQVRVIFTAHSLPVRIVAEGDPYPRQLEESARLVAGAAGVTRWRTGWQSAGRTADPWLGPDIQEILREMQREGERAALICPVGFVADHLEVLYDLDIECRQLGAELGMQVERTESLNAAPDFTAAIATIIREHLEGRQ